MQKMAHVTVALMVEEETSVSCLGVLDMALIAVAMAIATRQLVSVFAKMVGKGAGVKYLIALMTAMDEVFVMILYPILYVAIVR